MSRRSLLTGALVALIITGCSDDGGDGNDGSDTTATAVTTEAGADSTATTEPVESTVPDTTDAPATTPEATTVAETTTTVDLAALATTYAEYGPYPVGVTTLALADGNPVEVWYPAVEGTTGEVSYDVRDYVPPAIRDLLTADVPASFTFPGARDPEAAQGTFPVVLFSHGFTGINVNSSFLTSHLASWGMVVAAPEHPSRDLTNVLGGTATGDRGDSVDELLQTLDLLLAENDGTGALSGRIDAEHVAAVGHSAGGGTIVGAALDERIDGYVSMASGVAVPGDEPVDPTQTTVAPTPLPDKPSFFMAGAVDGVVPAEERTRPSFEAVPTPSRLWILDGVGHNGFDDFCTFGNGTGIIGIAEASGLGPLLEAQPQLRALGEDGCVPPAVPVDTTFPAIRHAVTSWLRELFGTDDEAIGIGPEVAGSYPVTVEIQERP